MIIKFQKHNLSSSRANLQTLFQQHNYIHSQYILRTTMLHFKVNSSSNTQSTELTGAGKRPSISESQFGDDSEDKEFLNIDYLFPQGLSKTESDLDTTNEAPLVNRPNKGQINNSQASSVSASIVGHIQGTAINFFHSYCLLIVNS